MGTKKTHTQLIVVRCDRRNAIVDEYQASQIVYGKSVNDDSIIEITSDDYHRKSSDCLKAIVNILDKLQST